MDVSERNKIVEKNLRLVVSRVLALNRGIYNDDLFQAGALALCLAADRFDPERGNAFTSFAVSYIDGYIRTYMSHDYVIKPCWSNGTFHRPSVLSIEAPVKRDSELTLGDTIPSEIDVENYGVDAARANDFMSWLSAIERSILTLRISGLTQQAIADSVGLHRTVVSRKLKAISEKYLRFKLKEM